VFERISTQSNHENFKPGRSQRAPSWNGSAGPVASRPDPVAAARRCCGRCLSPNHPRHACQNNIKCWHCKEWGHTL
jgi:hypothetical protein